MRIPPPPAVQRHVDPRTLRQLLLLLLPGERVAADADWTALYELAEAERVAALAWHRNGTVLRTSAPLEVVQAWRALAMRVALQVEVLLGTVAEAVGELRAAGVDVVMVKGAPLAYSLYGDATVRPLADCDLHVPLGQRGLASEVLSRAGWTSRTGEPPAEETFERWGGGQRNVIEVHSSLIDEALLAHIRIPVERRELSLGSATLPVFGGDLLPAFLAAHLAKHETAPLLWVIDLYTLWTSLGEAQRERARECARHVGLGRHLDWACALASCVPAGARGDTGALSALATLRYSRGDWARVRRLIALSANPFDAARVMAGRIWPEEWRDDWSRAPHYLVRRGAGWIARRLQVAGLRASQSSVRALAVDETELDTLLEDTLGRGLGIWIRARGTSMQPAIPPSAAAHIVPIGARPAREEDIVLARLPHGPLVLHRVQHVWSDKVQLKGDAMRRRDEVVERSALLGVCDRVEVNGVVYRAEERPRDAVALLTSAARTRLRRFLAARNA